MTDKRGRLHVKQVATIFGALLALFACSSGRQGAPSLPPLSGAVRPAMPRSDLVAVTPPPDGAVFNYLVSSSVVDASPSPAHGRDAGESGLVTVSWSVNNGSYALSLSPSPAGTSLPAEEDVDPFLIPGTYQFASTPSGLLETYQGYHATDGGANYCSFDQTITNTPAKTVAQFPLVSGTSYDGAVSRDVTLNYCSFAHARSSVEDSLEQHRNGSYALRDRYHQDNPLTRVVHDEFVYGNGSGSEKSCEGTTHSGSCTAYSWGTPVKIGGSMAIPFRTATSSFRAAVTPAKVRYVPDWYPKGVPAPLKTDTVTVVDTTMPSGCGAYASQAAAATVESIEELDPVAGTVSTTSNSAYYLPGAVMPACAISLQTTGFYDNRKTGALLRTATRTTTVVMNAAQTPTPAPTASLRHRDANGLKEV
jgi:hypothetical protein